MIVPLISHTITIIIAINVQETTPSGLILKIGVFHVEGDTMIGAGGKTAYVMILIIFFTYQVTSVNIVEKE